MLLPNAAAAALGVAAGPGFAIGAGTVVSVHGISLGPVPALPLLAALPDTQAVPLLAFVSQAVPVLAGLVAGAVLGRHLGDDDGGSVVAGLWGVLGGLLLGVAAGAVAAMAGGPWATARSPTSAPLRWRPPCRWRCRPASPARSGRPPPAGGPSADAARRVDRVAVVPGPDSPPRARVVVLLSGTGSLCAALLEAADEPGYPAQVVAVGADREAPASSTPAAGAFRRSPSRCATSPTGPPGTPRWPARSPRTGPTWWCPRGS
ncbi:hypothetical protein JD79_02015 [Geodermatophilus normandii]|uniref:Uncharacterized protein n=1 Tax=Geodermatophilus normandii TaxID=1137989 RepID=A0A317QHP9_9ACTN|nr:DUF6350 family protein [Geodermatophilus normandii]PWW22852.1 hypothetical protein JD79_02015 [Geodermatophilus normandii]